MVQVRGCAEGCYVFKKLMMRVVTVMVSCTGGGGGRDGSTTASSFRCPAVATTTCKQDPSFLNRHERCQGPDAKPTASSKPTAEPPTLSTANSRAKHASSAREPLPRGDKHPSRRKRGVKIDRRCHKQSTGAHAAVRGNPIRCHGMSHLYWTDAVRQCRHCIGAYAAACRMRGPAY